MKPTGFLNTLRFVEAEGYRSAPAGVIVPASSVPFLAERLKKRASHYSSLRVTALRDRLIFWSVSDEVRLPWLEDELVYLTHMEKMIFFPIGLRPNLPAKWADRIVGRLSEWKGLLQPILLLPSGEEPVAIGLGRSSSPVPVVDWGGMAGHDA